jgi:hypothetical protein
LRSLGRLQTHFSYRSSLSSLLFRSESNNRAPRSFQPSPQCLRRLSLARRSRGTTRKPLSGLSSTAKFMMPLISLMHIQEAGRFSSKVRLTAMLSCGSLHEILDCECGVGSGMEIRNSPSSESESSAAANFLILFTDSL